MSRRSEIVLAVPTSMAFMLPGLMSCAPAYVALVAEAQIDAGVRRGIPAEQFEKDKKELFEGARKAAANRVKVQLILAKVAEAEKLTITDRDIDLYIRREAARSNQRPDKLAKDLAKDRNALRSVHQAIIFDKSVDFLVSKATLTVSNP